MAKRKTFTVLLTLIMMISLIPAAVFADDHPENGWYNRGTKAYPQWVYYRDGEQVAGEWIKDGGKWYYLDLNGLMVSNRAVKDGTKVYLLGKDGALVTKKGWVSIKITFVLPPDASQDMTEVIPAHTNEYWYYLKSGGVCTTGWKKISGKWYYFSTDSAVMVSSISFPDGCMIGTKMYFFNKDGSLKTKCWIEDSDGFWYYVDKSGESVTGWQKIGKKWYCFFESGRMMYKDWKEEPSGSGNWYYLGEDGVMVVNSLVNSLGDLYYQGKDGRGINGWKKIDGNWYYFNPDKQGAAVKDCTIQIGSMWYTFDSNCICTNPEGSSEEPQPAPATGTGKPIELPFVPADAL